MYEAPVAGGAALTLMFAAGVVGDLTADVIDRYFAGIDPTATSPQLPAAYAGEGGGIAKYNADAVAMKPGFARIASQLVLGAIAITIGVLATTPAVKFLFYGFGFGAGFHLAGQLTTAYILEPMLANSNAGARMYQHEINVNPATTTTTTTTTQAGPGLLRSMGQPPKALPEKQPVARVPVALASVATAPAGLSPNGTPAAMGQPPAPQPQAAAGCKAGCECSKCKPAQRIEASGNGSGASHPLWSMLLERQAA